MAELAKAKLEFSVTAECQEIISFLFLFPESKKNNKMHKASMTIKYS